ncbi:Ankyrin repeat-containing protein [Glarea lozoyensis ATCC 20868]|uniref:Ankyrin repeat-containing protein n=1 Tax=Glarea lozoyensis (strain ATCC 20868 / MF5171) TaxID=1116229 RepID=S3E146_GLAL2|nr:Ankyrin repeat-containing protein [Glarea lozoyensis ATCC 20868]EPE32228.1 Ankyrin repeat-containing protein [Glarea lozoyensis ATCC 20868]
MSGLEAFGASAAAFQFAEFIFKAAKYVKKYAEAGKGHYERLDNLYSNFAGFHDTLKSVSTTASNVARSDDGKEHARETEQIKNMVADCRSILIRMLEVSGKFKQGEESPSRFKLAVHSWVYDQNGKEKIDGMIQEIRDVTMRITLTLTMINTNQLISVSKAVRGVERTATDNMVVTLESVKGDGSGTTSSVETVKIPPPAYTEKPDWGLSIFTQQNFDFDATDLSKSLVDAIESNNYTEVKALLLKGENPLAESEDCWCALHYAVRTDSKRIMRALLASKQVKDLTWGINKEDKNGETPLHLAASLGKKNMLRVLIEGGADFNAKSKSGRTPLFKAVEGNHEEIVEILLEKNAVLKPDVAPPGSLVPKRLKEMRVAINHRKLQVRKGKT